MAAAFFMGVTVSTGFGAVILAILFHSLIGGNDA
jgi:hypothetical protein